MKNLRKEDVIAFIENDVVPYNSSDTIIGLLLFLVFGLIVGLSNPLREIASSVILCSFICYLIGMFRYDNKRTVYNQHLFLSGVTFCFSMIALFASYKFFLGIQQIVNIPILLLLVGVYLANIVLLYCSQLKKIGRGVYTSNESIKKSIKASNGFSIIGFGLAIPIVLFFVKSSDTNNVLLVVATGLFFSALFICVGYRNLLKVILQVKFHIPDKMLADYFREKNDEINSM